MWYYMIIISCFFISCGRVLLSPVKGGFYYRNDSLVKGSPYIGGDLNYIEVRKSLKVRAIESCVILNASKLEESYYIMAIGKVTTGYYKLAKIFISKGDSIKKGQFIGELFSKDSVFDNSLQIVVLKNGKAIHPNW